MASGGRVLIECYYCGERSPEQSQSCSNCNTNFSFLRAPTSELTADQLHGWLFSEHFQICEQVERTGIASLTDAQRINYFVGYLYFQAENGGVWQYFSNPCGPDAPLLATTLEQIGASMTASAIRECLAYFPSSVPPFEMNARDEIIAQIPEPQATQLDNRIVALLLGEQSDDDGMPKEDVLRLLKQAVDARL